MDFIENKSVQNRIIQILDIIHMDISWEDKIELLEIQLNIH
ncbi:hypothetical protein [[Clostridium] dakarense]|nr:hypothetical protein [[Clostridium] dakarense]